MHDAVVHHRGPKHGMTRRASRGCYIVIASSSLFPMAHVLRNSDVPHYCVWPADNQLATDEPANDSSRTPSHAGYR